MSNQFDIVFNVNAHVRQTIEPLKGYSITDIVDGLNHGVYFTTLSYEDADDGGLILKINDDGMETVAIIVAQSVDESDYRHFVLEHD